MILSALALLSLATASYADPPDTYLIGVELSLTTSTATESLGYRKEQPFQLNGLKPRGYATVSALDIFDKSGNPVAETDIFNKIRSGPGMRFCPAELLHKIPAPQDVVAIANEHGCPHIDSKVVISLKPWSGKFDRNHGYAWPVAMNPQLVELIVQKKLVYSCAVSYAESLYWMSFNPKIGESDLQPICKRTPATAPTKEETAAMKSKPLVFLVAMPYD